MVLTLAPVVVPSRGYFARATSSGDTIPSGGFNVIVCWELIDPSKVCHVTSLCWDIGQNKECVSFSKYSNSWMG